MGKTDKPIAAVLAAIFLSAAAASAAAAAQSRSLTQPGAILVRINGEAVEKAEFRRFVEIAFPEETDPPPGRMQALADSFVHHRLLAARARAEGIDRLPAVRSRLATRLNRLWTDVFWSDVAKASIRIDEKDIEAMAPATEEAISLQQLTAETAERAGELRGMAVAGADFGEIVKSESIGLTAQNGGYVGFVTRDSPLYPPELLEELFRLQPGEYSAVTKTDLGYAVVKVLEIKTASRMREEWLERNRERLLRTLRREAWNRWKEQLADSLECVVDREAVEAYLLARKNGASLEPHLGKVAVTVEGVPFLLADLVDPSGMGILHAEETAEGIARRRVEEFAMAREIERRGLREKHPDVLLTERLLGDYLLAREYVEFRSRVLAVTEEERREYYEAHRAKFTAPRAYRFSLIETRSPARLRLIYDLLEKGTSFAEVASRWSDGGDAAEGLGGFVEERRVPPDLLPATKLPPGEYARTPFRIEPANGGNAVWIVPRLDAVREERVVPFEEIDRSSVTKSVMARKRERLIREILGELRRENRIEFPREASPHPAQEAGG